MHTPTSISSIVQGEVSSSVSTSLNNYPASMDPPQSSQPSSFSQAGKINIAKHDIIRILVFIISPYGLSKLAADINVHLAFSGVRLGSKRNNSPVDVSSK